jgi:magnesium transporter
MPLLPSGVLRRYRPFRRRTKPGAEPGTIRVAPEAPPPEIHVIGYGPDVLEEHDLGSVDELPPLLERFPIVWVNVEGLGDERTLIRLGELFHIHPLALEDVVHVHQRAKVEEYPEHLFIVARMVRLTDAELESEQVSVFLGRNYVLTFQYLPGDSFDPVRARLRTSRGRIRSAGADFLAYALLDATIDGYFPVLEAYGTRIEDLEDRMVEQVAAETIHQTHRLRSDLMLLRRFIWPHREAAHALLRDENPLISAETRVYLRDCYDHTVQIIDVVETHRDLCSDLRELYFTQLGTRTNEIMKVLTIIATIFIPLSFVAGLYGMNFDTSVSPWNMPELKWRFGYPFALGVMAAVAGSLLYFFWRRGWIGRGKG